MNPSNPARRRRLRRNGLWRLTTLPLLMFILIPLIALLIRAGPDGVLENLSSPQVLQAIRLSMVSSFSAVLLTVVFGTPVAYYLSHRHYKLHRLVDTLIDLPTVLPPAVAGVALLMAFGRRGLVGAWLDGLGITIPFTTFAVILAQTFIAAPLYIKSAAFGFASIDCELRKAAALDGAGRWQTFLYVMLPMSWMSIMSGCVLTWARALGEFGATIIFAGNFPGRTQTMPLAIYIGFELDLSVALTLSVILIGLSFLTLVLVKGILYHWAEVEPEDHYD